MQNAEPKKPAPPPPPAPKKPDPKEQAAQDKTKEQIDNPKPADNGNVVVGKETEPTSSEIGSENEPTPDTGDEEPNADNTVSPPLEDDEVKVTDDEGNELKESFGARRNRFTP